MFGHFSWHRFVFIQLWIFVLFLIFTTGAELNRLFGYGMLATLFFTRRSSEFLLSRRQRIKTLVRLSHITERHVRRTRAPGHRCASQNGRIAEDAWRGRASSACRRGAHVDHLDGSCPLLNELTECHASRARPDAQHRRVIAHGRITGAL